MEIDNIAAEQTDSQELPYSNGEAVYDVVSGNDEHALKFLLRRIRTLARLVPPFDDREKDSAALSHLWDVVLRKTDNDPNPDAVFFAACIGRFDYLPHEVKNRLIDDARKASAQKRGGDGERLPLFDSLTLEGAVESNRDKHDDELFNEPAQIPRPKGGIIEWHTRDVWLRITEDLRRRELAADPSLNALGPAAKLYRFYLEHDHDRWTDAEVARELGVTDRTIRNYRRLLVRYLRPDAK